MNLLSVTSRFICPGRNYKYEPEIFILSTSELKCYFSPVTEPHVHSCVYNCSRLPHRGTHHRWRQQDMNCLVCSASVSTPVTNKTILRRRHNRCCKKTSHIPLSLINKSGETRVLNALFAISFRVRLLQIQYLSYYKKHKPIFVGLVSYGYYTVHA
jgi:hypothetical protein